MFTNGFSKYACDGDTITCEIDGFDLTATIHHDDDADAPDEMQDGFWPSKDEKDAGYFPHKTQAEFDAEMDRCQHVMDAWKSDDWWYVGIAVTASKAGVELTAKYEHAVWGIDCNYPGSDNSYLTEVANDLAGEAVMSARAKIAQLCSKA